MIYTELSPIVQSSKKILEVLHRCTHSLTVVALSIGTNKVYGCVVDMKDHLVRKDGGQFDMEDFHAHPEEYASNFSRKVKPPHVL